MSPYSQRMNAVTRRINVEPLTTLKIVTADSETTVLTPLCLEQVLSMYCDFYRRTK